MILKFFLIHISSFEIHELLKCQLIEAVWCEITVGKERILVGCIYRPPASSRETSQSINKMIFHAKKMTDTKKFNGLLIAGDFNHPDFAYQSINQPFKNSHH